MIPGTLINPFEKMSTPFPGPGCAGSACSFPLIPQTGMAISPSHTGPAPADNSQEGTSFRMSHDKILSPHIILRDDTSGRWLHFSSPQRIIAARCLDEVLPALREVEAAVETGELHAAGFVSYEAAPAFDPALPAMTDDGAFPFLWFGLFPPPDALSALPAPDAGMTAPIEWQPSVSGDEYTRSLARIREYIRDGHTYQVNFTYRLHAGFDADPWAVFRRIMAEHPAPFAAFADTGDWVICSASPELFFRLDAGRIESRPMKGTAPRGLWPADDEARAAGLLASHKERAENLMIVDMARNDIGRVANTGSVHVPALFSLEKYPTVWQMTSTVRAETSASLTEILQALFPPASITGAPKKRTMEIIRELETTPRRIYTGTIGFISPGRTAQFSVVIRTLLINRATRVAEYGVGGGIVWDSKTNLEREECDAKTRVLHFRRPAFDLVETFAWTPENGYSLLKYHLERLAQSARYFDFVYDPDRVGHELRFYSSGFSSSPHRVRLLLSRDGAVRIESRPLPLESRLFTDVVLDRRPVDPSDVFLYHKTTHRVTYEDALRRNPGFSDVLLYNDRGEVTETTRANVAVERDGVLITPPVRCGLLGGTYRAWTLETGRAREGVITLQEVLDAPRIHLMNAVRGLSEVGVILPRGDG